MVYDARTQHNLLPVSNENEWHPMIDAHCQAKQPFFAQFDLVDTSHGTHLSMSHGYRLIERHQSNHMYQTTLNSRCLEMARPSGSKLRHPRPQKPQQSQTYQEWLLKLQVRLRLKKVVGETKSN